MCSRLLSRSSTAQVANDVAGRSARRELAEVRSDTSRVGAASVSPELCHNTRLNGQGLGSTQLDGNRC
jgi:hypothetical protein